MRIAFDECGVSSRWTMGKMKNGENCRPDPVVYSEIKVTSK
jgi:hypothetical protein